MKGWKDCRYTQSRNRFTKIDKKVKVARTSTDKWEKRFYFMQLSSTFCFIWTLFDTSRFEWPANEKFFAFYGNLSPITVFITLHTSSYPEPDESSQHCHSVSVRPILILSSHRYFLRVCRTTCSYAFPIRRMRATGSLHLMLTDLRP
jgi:hypothetical protein